METFLLTPESGTAEQRQRLFTFLQSIGLEVIAVDAGHGFLDDIQMVNGHLHVAPQATLDAILHEAGHLSITPKPFRSWMTGDMSEGIEAMFSSLTQQGCIDGPVWRAAVQCSDPEATAWAWAAGQHLGFPDHLIILDTSYDGEGADVRVALKAKRYIGIHGLTHAGMCQHGYAARHKGGPTYPDLFYWTQDGPFLELGADPNPVAPVPAKRRP